MKVREGGCGGVGCSWGVGRGVRGSTHQPPHSNLNPDLSIRKTHTTRFYGENAHNPGEYSLLKYQLTRPVNNSAYTNC